MEFVNIKDRKVPLGKRKVAFVKWLMIKGVELNEAKLICSRKFYYEDIQAEKERRNK